MTTKYAILSKNSELMVKYFKNSLRDSGKKHCYLKNMTSIGLTCKDLQKSLGMNLSH